MSRPPPISIFSTRHETVDSEQKRRQDDARRFALRLREDEVTAQELAMAEQERELERQETEAAEARLRNTDYASLWHDFTQRNQLRSSPLHPSSLASSSSGSAGTSVSHPIDVDEEEEDENPRDPEYADGYPSPVPSEPDYPSDEDEEPIPVRNIGVPFTSLFPPRSPTSPSEPTAQVSEAPQYSSFYQSYQWKCPTCQVQLGESTGNYVCNCDNPTQLCSACGTLGSVGAQCSCMQNPF